MTEREYNLRLYHLGFLKHRRPDTVILQARACLDLLDCELWYYLGARRTTKKHLRESKAQLLNWINHQTQKNFTRLIID